MAPRSQKSQTNLFPVERDNILQQKQSFFFCQEMGNCQAIDIAAVVIQHPSGRTERMYWPVSASEMMRKHPGHYVSLTITIPISDERNHGPKTASRFTCVRLLKPEENLLLGHAYCLITPQEVTKVLRAKRYVNMNSRAESDAEQKDNPGLHKDRNWVRRREMLRPRKSSINSRGARLKKWRPSLHSIVETLSSEGISSTSDHLLQEIALNLTKGGQYTLWN